MLIFEMKNYIAREGKIKSVYKLQWFGVLCLLRFLVMVIILRESLTSWIFLFFFFFDPLPFCVFLSENVL